MATPTRRPGNVPAETTSFVGRRHELTEARRKLSTARLVTLVGPGGVGKTRLAMRLAATLGRGSPGGAWLVELAELRDPALVDHAALSALDLRDQAGADPRVLLTSYLEDKHLLLVLDNCEHLLDAAAGLVGAVLGAAPGVRVIATSREPLSVRGEHVLPVPPLQLPSPYGAEPLARLAQNEAVMLFAERAAAASGDFALTEANRSAVVDLCRRLDGLPLAIELAAVRTRALSPEQIRDRLANRFDLLTGGGRGALPRHQTLRTAIEWSHDLLAPRERSLLARLCVFAGRFTLDDVEAVCIFGELPVDSALDLLSALLDRSLVVKEDAGGVACYRMHESMREYARLRLREAGEEDAVERRCLDHYSTRCQRFAAEGRYRLLAWLPWIELEVDNVRAVLRRCLDRDDVGRATDLATSLIWYWVTRGTTEGVRWLDETLARVTEPEEHPWAYFVRGFLAVQQSDDAAATAALERGIAACRASGELDALSQSLAMASIAATMAGDRSAARRLLDDARDVADGLGALGATLMVQQARSLNGLVDRDADTARTAAAEGARLSREAGDAYSLGMMLMNQGFAALASGAVAESELRFAEGLGIARELDDRLAQCYLFGGLACCAAARGEQRRAARLLGAMEGLRREVGGSLNAGMAPALARAATAAEAALGASRFRAEHAAGSQLGRGAAVRLALGEAAPAGNCEAGRGSRAVLGRREAEVAGLVADGLTNREIGSSLFLSERTVETHVRNILNKLGFTNRAQIAAWKATSRG